MATPKTNASATTTAKKREAAKVKDDTKKESEKVIKDLITQLDAIGENLKQVIIAIDKKNKRRNANVQTIDTKIEQATDALREELKKIEEHAASSSAEMSAQVKASLAQFQKAAKKLLELTVINTPTELTTLNRFLAFWDASVSKLLEAGQKGNLTLIKDTEVTKNGFRDSKGNGYVDRGEMASFMNALYLAMKTDPTKDVQQILNELAGNPAADGVMRSLSGVTDVLANLVGLSQPDASIVDWQGGGIDKDYAKDVASLDATIKSLNSSANEEASFYTENTDKAVKKRASQEKNLQRLISRSATGTLNVTYEQRSATSKAVTKGSLTGADFNSLLALLRSGKVSALNFDYTDTTLGGITSSKARLAEDRAAIDAYKASEAQRRFNVEYKNAVGFLRGITVSTTGPEGKPITKQLFGNDVERIGALFFASYFNLPKFAVGDLFKDLGDKADLDKMLGSEALPVARQNLARVMIRMVYDAVNASQGTIKVPDVIYRRDNKRGMKFGKDSKEDIVDQILYGMSPTGYPTDWNMTAAVNQSFGVKIGDETYSILSNKTRLAEGILSDPSGAYGKISDAQGDHAIALSAKGKTIPMQLSSLTSAENQSKLDAATGQDQLIQRAMTYSNIFEQDAGWEDGYSDMQALTKAEQDTLGAISADRMNAKKKDFKWPKAEIMAFERERTAFNAINSNTEFANLTQIYVLYQKIYAQIDKDYAALASLVNKAEDTIAKRAKTARISIYTLDFKDEADKLLAVEKSIKIFETRLSKADKIASAGKTKMLDIYSTLRDMVKAARMSLTTSDDFNPSMVFKGALMEFLSGLATGVEVKRKASIEILNTAFASVANVFEIISNDLAKGPQSYRGSKTIKARGKKKLSFVAPKGNIGDYLKENIQKYEENMKEWEKNKKIYKDKVGSISGRGINANTLGELEDFLEGMFEARQYLYFSEFFE